MTQTPNDGVTIIVPIATDLIRKDDHIECGPMTRRACDEAIALARDTPDSVILLTATKAEEKYNNVVMGKIMEAYIKEQAPEVRTAFMEAPEFNTLGEVKAALWYLRNCLNKREPVRRMLFVVKHFQAKRLRLIVDTIFSTEDVLEYRHYRVHTIEASFWTRQYWDLYEWLAIKKNRKRLKELGYTV